MTWYFTANWMDTTIYAWHFDTKAEAVNVRRGFASTRQKGWVGEPSPVMKGDIKHVFYN